MRTRHLRGERRGGKSRRRIGEKKQEDNQDDGYKHEEELYRQGRLSRLQRNDEDEKENASRHPSH